MSGKYVRKPVLRIPEAELRHRYLELLAGYQELCRFYKVNVGNLIATLDHYKIPRRKKRGPRSAKHHGSWNGGRRLDKHGYVLVYCPDHPHASCSKCVREHRLVMEAAIGRYLDPKEVVHHKNGKKDDNRIENLELFSKNSEHLKHELSGKVPKWTAEGLQRIQEGIRKPRKRRGDSKTPDE